MATRTRWGIVSVGRISHDFVTALLMLPSEHQVSAVAARELARAEEFASRFNIAKSYGSYEDMAQDPDLDVVYVACIHPVHYVVCKMLMNAGKNVLVEKPAAMNSWQTQELVELSKQKNVFFSEGYWSRYFPAYKQLKKDLEAGVIGKPMFVTVNFGFGMQDVPRVTEKELGGGALLDLGGYHIQFAQFIFGGERPQRIVATGTLNKNNVDIAETITLHYSGNRMAQLNVHAGCSLSQTAHISGTSGIIEVPMMWCPTEYTTPCKRFYEPLPNNVPFPLNHIRSEGFVYQAQDIRSFLLKDEKESMLITHQDTLMIMEIMDEVRRQLGVVYSVDNT